MKTPLEFVASALRATGAEVRTALPLARDAARHGHAALLLPAADRLRRDRRDVGVGRRARQPHELRGGPSKNAVRGVRVPLSEEQTLALKIGAPEFQRQ